MVFNLEYILWFSIWNIFMMVFNLEYVLWFSVWNNICYGVQFCIYYGFQFCR